MGLCLCKVGLFGLLLTTNMVWAKKINPIQDNQLIILFHGFGNYAHALYGMQNELKKAFPHAMVIAPTSVEGEQSIMLSIQQQAASNFKELTDKVEALSDKAIILIGHSQGGLRAYAFFQQYKDLLNIKGLVALATPWEGAPGARVDSKMLSEHLTPAVKKDLQTLSVGLNYAPDLLTTHLKEFIQQNQTVRSFPGADDLTVGSRWMQQVATTLPYTQLPMLCIGGGQGDFGSFLLNNKKKYSFKALNNMYRSFVVGKAGLNHIHDMWIPLYSQHALNIMPKHNKNFSRIFIKDAYHSSSIWGILVSPTNKVVPTHPQVLHSTIQFIKRVFVAPFSA